MEIEDLAALLNERVDAVCAVCRERSGNIQKSREEDREILLRIERKVDAANGRSRRNAWNIRAIWAIFAGAWAVALIWIKAKLG